MPRSTQSALIILAGLVLIPVVTSAQPLGPFSWQFSPFCNVVTLTAVAQGPFFSLSGTDDQCGAGVVGSVSGTATLRPDGTVAMGLTIVTDPGVLIAAQIDLSDTLALSGTWGDTAGNSGSFLFSPAIPAAGTPRPTPPPLPGPGVADITTVLAGPGLVGGGSIGDVMLSVNFAGSGAAATAARSDHTHASPPGSTNTAVGPSALQSISTGSSNTAVGNGALQTNATGNGNTAVGNGALQNSTGTANTAVGGSALRSVTSASGNTAVGQGALQESTSGPNTAVGDGALRNDTVGNNNTAVGVNALVNTTTGDSNTAVGHLALTTNVFGNGNTAIGVGANVSSNNLSNATAIGAGAIVDASNKVRIGSDQVVVIEGQVPFTFPSDRSEKEGFRPVDAQAVLDKLRRIPVESWNYRGHDPAQFRHYGPVAQDFHAAFGHDGVGAIGTPTTLNSGDVAGILMLAVQALAQRVEALQAHNGELRDRLETLERRLSGRPALAASQPAP
jgi:hypothetical protein